MGHRVHRFFYYMQRITHIQVKKNCNPNKILLTKYSVQRTFDVSASSVRDTPMVTSMILTVFPLPGGGINESEQLISSDSFRVDIM